MCHDSRHYWRRDFFPEYKANRRKGRKESSLDWDAIFECLNAIKEEIRINMPYKFLEVYGAEADDIIATICSEYAEEIMIISGDKDFIQLQRFPNVKQYDQLYITGPISIDSTCAHHFQPINGKCYIGIFPGDKVIGLSKFNRVVDWVASRPQIQEEMTEQIADMIEKETEAKGVAVIIKAQHFCMTARGVKEHESDMLTSVLRGILRDDDSLRLELFSLLNNMKGMK